LRYILSPVDRSQEPVSHQELAQSLKAESHLVGGTTPRSTLDFPENSLTQEKVEQRSRSGPRREKRVHDFASARPFDVQSLRPKHFIDDNIHRAVYKAIPSVDVESLLGGAFRALE
jgi:hypothetical protein